MRACCDDAHVKDECGFFGSNEEKDHHLGVYEDGYESLINIRFVNKRLQTSPSRAFRTTSSYSSEFWVLFGATDKLALLSP